MGFIDTGVDSSVDANPVPDDEATAGVRNVAGDQSLMLPAADEAEASAKKRPKVNVKDDTLVCFDHLRLHHRRRNRFDGQLGVYMLAKRQRTPVHSTELPVCECF